MAQNMGDSPFDQSSGLKFDGPNTKLNFANLGGLESTPEVMPNIVNNGQVNMGNAYGDQSFSSIVGSRSPESLHTPDGGYSLNGLNMGDAYSGANAASMMGGSSSGGDSSSGGSSPFGSAFSSVANAMAQEAQIMNASSASSQITAQDAEALG